MRLMLVPPVILLSGALGAAGGDGARAAGIDRAMAGILARPEFRSSTFGVAIARAPTGEVIYEHGSTRLLAPASNTKIVSCAGALAALGKDFRFETRIAAAGPIRDGLLEGDLVLIGSGDPNLSQRIGSDGRLLFADKDHSYAGFYDAELVKGDPLAVVKDLARQVARAGIRKVRGDVVADDGLFEETEDEFIGSFSAICVNDNLIDVLVEPGARPGEPARFEYQPRGSAVEVSSSVTTTPEGTGTDVWLEKAEGTASFSIRGSIAIRTKPVLRVAPFPRPAIAAATFLGDALRELGIEVTGKERQARLGPRAYSKHSTVALHVSPPLAEAIRVILKVSHNLHATMLPVVVGSVKGGRAERRTGYRVIHDLFEGAGLDMDAVVLQSGSGGGRADAVSARWMADFLVHLAARNEFPAFLDALPAGGVDGTLSTAFKDPVFASRVRAKTGTLVYRGALNENWIYVSKSLSGYLDLRSAERPGELLVFSIIIGNTVSTSRKKGADDLFRAQEDLLKAVIQSTGTGTGAEAKP